MNAVTELINNRAVRVLTHSSYDADANQLLTELGWDNLKTRRQKLIKAEMVYKSLNGKMAGYSVENATRKR